MPHQTHNIIEDVRIIKEYRQQGEKWVGNNGSFTTMNGYTGVNGVWQKCIDCAAIGGTYTMTKIFAYSPDKDEITRLQAVYGSNPQIEFNNGNYSEALFMFNGSSYGTQEVTFKRVCEFDLWVRPVISNDPGGAATIKFFICIQKHEV